MKKTPIELNKLASFIVDQATNEEPQLKPPRKNKTAQELGRLGGLKGGKARAERMTPGKRSEIARLAATARWKKTEG